MSQELDRKIAELVMGEPEPPSRYTPGVDEEPYDLETDLSAGGNWLGEERYGYRDVTVIEWQPLPFSTNLDLAMRAINELLGGKRHSCLRLDYQPFDQTYDATLSVWQWDAVEHLPNIPLEKLPEAICRLLLDLVEKERGIA